MKYVLLVLATAVVGFSIGAGAAIETNPTTLHVAHVQRLHP